MIVFVNARPVDSRTLNYALIESYNESLPKGRYPLAFVFFECDPASVDVNVHPAKREVRFRSEPQVRGFVIRAVLQRLRELAGPIADRGLRIADFPSSENEAAGMGAQNRIPETGYRSTESGNSTTAPAGTASPPPAIHRADMSALRAVASNSPVSGIRFPVSAALPSADTAVPLASNPQSAIRNPQFTAAWRFLGLAHGNFALFETAAGIVLLDRRAAHERVWFERLREQFRAGAVPSQRLLLPVPIELDAIAAALLLDRLSFLHAHGFEIGEFGRNFFRVEAVPAWMEPADAESFLRDLIGAFREGTIPDRDTELARDELARLAAAKAVRLPASNGEAELRGLVTQLFATRTPLTSPAGRPTYIELNHSELARRFQK
jgi:DNA mismatch repair protein MutL